MIQSNRMKTKPLLSGNPTIPLHKDKNQDPDALLNPQKQQITT